MSNLKSGREFEGWLGVLKVSWSGVHKTLKYLFSFLSLTFEASFGDALTMMSLNIGR